MHPASRQKKTYVYDVRIFVRTEGKVTSGCNMANVVIGRVGQFHAIYYPVVHLCRSPVLYKSFHNKLYFSNIFYL